MKSGKNHCLIQLCCLVLGCVLIACLCHAVGKEVIITNDDIMTGKLKIDLADELRFDQQCSKELVDILRESGLQAKAIASQWSTAKEYAERALELTVPIAQFACDHPDTSSALTAKLVCIDRLRSCNRNLNNKKRQEQLAGNRRSLLEKIVNQHPRTWQASIAYLKLVRMTQGDTKAIQHKRRIERYKELLEMELVELPANDPEYEACLGWVTYPGAPIKSKILRALAASQQNLGILNGYDARWLNEAKLTQQQLLDRYPDSKWGKHAINSIRNIDNLLDRHCK